MSETLTERQLRAIDAHAEEPTRLIDPRTNVAYVLVPAEDFDAIRDLIEEDRQERAIAAIAMRNALERATDAP